MKDSSDEAIDVLPLHQKWGEALDEGFVLIPNALLRYQRQLGLTHAELVALVNLLMTWWEPQTWPHLRTSTLARRMNVTTRTAQRHIEQLEDKGFLRRRWSKADEKQEHAAATYDLSGTVHKLKRYGGFVQSAPPPEGGGPDVTERERAASLSVQR